MRSVYQTGVSGFSVVVHAVDHDRRCTVMATKKKAPAAKKSSFDPSKYICNVVPSKETERDWSFGDSIAAGASPALAAAAPPPASFDMRKSWWTINQQEKTGSCVGWATADGVGRFHMQKKGKITQSQMLSPRFVWMGSKETDTITNRPESFIEEAGTTLKAAMDVARKYGFALESDLPFHIDTTMYSGSEDEFYASCAQRKIASYFNLHKNLSEWKAWLFSNGPILVGFSVDASWDHAGTNAGKIDTFQPSTTRGGHAVAVVGYKADGRFIVRNSWGTGWGDKGFGYVSATYIADAFFDEAYGVTV